MHLIQIYIVLEYMLDKNISKLISFAQSALAEHHEVENVEVTKLTKNDYKSHEETVVNSLRKNPVFSVDLDEGKGR